LVEAVGFTAAVAVVAPLLQAYVVAPLALRVTVLPAQTELVLDEAVTVGFCE
jgi:hypothetical protein